MLALYKDKLNTGFSEVRKECDPKERWAEPLLKELGTDSPGRGRKAAMTRLAGLYRSVRDTCPELGELEARISAWRKAAS
jgi:hypothetical protein